MRSVSSLLKVTTAAVFLLTSIGCSSTKKHLRNLNHQDINLRISSVHRLGMLGPKADRAFPELVRTFNESDNQEIRREIVRVLGLFGKNNRNAAAEILTNALFDTDSLVRRNAVVALADINPFPTGAFSALIQALGDSDYVVRDLAMSTLIDYSSYCTHTLNRALRDKSPVIRSMVAQILGCIGAGARNALPNLTLALNDEDERVRTNAGLAIRQIKSQIGSNRETEH